MKQKLLLFIAIIYSTFSFSQLDLGPDQFLCEGNTVLLNADTDGTVVSYEWSFNGSILPNETNSVLSVNQSGLYGVIVVADNVTTSDEVELTFYEFPQAYTSEYIICDNTGFTGDGLAEFYLDDYASFVTDDIGSNTVTFHLTEEDAFFGENPLDSPFTNTVSGFQTIYSRVINTEAMNNNVDNCSSLASFYLQVISLPEANTPTPYELCGTNGFATFNLEAKSAEVNSAGFTVKYFETESDAFNDQNALPLEYTNISNPQTIYTRVTDGFSFDCFSTSELQLVVNDGTPPNANTIAPVSICDSQNVNEYDLTIHEAEILGGQSNVTITYFNNPNNLINNTNPISDPTSVSLFTFGNYSFYARIDNNSDDCYSYSEINIAVTVSPQANTVTLNQCSNDNSGIAVFDLASQISNINPQSNVSITFYEIEADATNGVNPIANPSNYNNTINPQTIYSRVENLTTGCFGIGVLELFVEEIPAVNTPTNLEVCDTNNDGFAFFDLELKTPEILGGIDPSSYTVTYHESQFDADQGTNAVSSPYGNVANPQTIFVRMENNQNFQCFTTTSFDLIALSIPTPATPTPLIACDENGDGIVEFDLDSKVDEIINGELDVSLSFHATQADVVNNVNQLSSPYTTPGIIYARVSNNITSCFSIVSLELIVEDCPEIVDCSGTPITVEYCYELNDATQYNFESNDGSHLIVNFVAGEVEFDYDALIVLDSDGVTNLNTNTPYGDNGDLTGLVFASSGNRISLYVDSDNIMSCSTENYTPINYTVSCFDPTALPNCDADLITPVNGEIDVEENTNFTWTQATPFVTGYRISIGTTSGGTDFANNVNVGNSLVYNPSANLDFDTTYYVTITPYNDNGDAIDCIENSFTTRSNPNLIDCNNPPVNTEYCYVNDDSTQFHFESLDGSQITVVFNAGIVEYDFDPLVVLDSDGVTDLNAATPFGINDDGDVTNLTYTSSGGSLTIYVNADDIESCDESGFTPLNFDVFCNNSIGLIQVNAFEDSDNDSTFDSNEMNFTNGYFTYEKNNDGVMNTVNSSTGSFTIISEEASDSYDINYYFYDEYVDCFDATISIFNDVSVATGETVNIDFPIVEESSCEDLAVYLVNNSTPPRPGFNHKNYLIIENLGLSTIASGSVIFVVDDLLDYISTFNVNSNYTVTDTSNGFVLDFVNIQPGESESIGINLFCPATVDLDTVVTNYADYITAENDINLVNNKTSISEIVIGSWDPNDKMESHGPKVLYDDFTASDEYLYYTIRFQNLGTADAINVRIEDVLDSQLDETTFQNLKASHNYVVTRINNNLEWQFDNINLPAEQDDEEGSKGFVYFKIKPKAGYAIGDIIPNEAAIYFDFNAPVITNTFETEFIEEQLSLIEYQLLDSQLIPNPAKDIVNLKLSSLLDLNISIYDIQGKLILNRDYSETNAIKFNVADFESGMYFIKLKSNQLEVTKKLIVE